MANPFEEIIAQLSVMSALIEEVLKEINRTQRTEGSRPGEAVGHYVSKRHANRLEAQPAKSLPDPPPEFDGRHADKWRELVSNMQDMGTLANQDLDSIRAYVVFFFRFADANETINKQGTIVDIGLFREATKMIGRFLTG